MSRRPENPGICAFCGESMTKRGVLSHLKKCVAWRKIQENTAVSNRPEGHIWHLRVQDMYDPDFWLDLDMDGRATLDRLDYYLRAIWLECCEHLSMFSFHGPFEEEIEMTCRADTIFTVGLKLFHVYDFGTSSKTVIKVAGCREGKAASRHPLMLLARNRMPEYLCQECGQKARWLCLECQVEYEQTGFLCDDHLDDHPHHAFGEPMQLFNSPRSGMCGYSGPALPPY